MCLLITSSPSVKEPHNQVHRPVGILPCPCCNRELCVVRSYESSSQGCRLFYVACDNEEECEGVFEGPKRTSVRDAVRDSNAALLRFATAALSRTA